MIKNSFFPAIDLKKRQDYTEASSAIRLTSIKSVRLLESAGKCSGARPSSFELHRSLIQAISYWPDSITLSLNFLTIPDVKYPLAGKVQTAILLTVRGEEEQSVKAELISRHATLLSLLSRFLERAEFEMVIEKETVKKWILPFTPKNVYAIDRFKDSFVLTVESEEKPQQFHPGFLTPPDTQTKTEAGNISVIEYLFPWQHEGSNDLSAIIEPLLFHPSPLWIQVRIRPSQITPDELSALKKSLTCCEELVNGLHSSRSILSHQTYALRAALSERIWQQQSSVFRGGCFICSQSHLDEALVGAVASAISPAVNSVEKPYLPLKGGNTIYPVKPYDFLNPDFVSSNGFFTTEEAACMFRIPMAEDQDPPGLPIKLFRTGPVDSALLRNTSQDMLLLGHNRHRGHINPIMVSDEDRMRHTFVLGQTGTGKSVFLESMILQDINRGKGLCFIDPHGDSVDRILQFYPEERADDLILIDLRIPDRIVPFNFLAWKDPEERDKIIDDLYGWMDLVYNMEKTGGPIFEQYFRAFLRLLMGDRPRSDFTPRIIDFSRLFNSESFLEYCLEYNSDPQVSIMIDQAMEARGDTDLRSVTPYITSKINRFVLNQTVKIMTGQPEMGIDFQDAMNSGKVVMVVLGRGHLSETASSLLASHIISRFHNAAMKRIEMRPENRRDFFLYVDEFQTVASRPFMSMLAEARKFRLALILANQYADQLENIASEGGDSVLKAVLGNVGNTTCFRLGVRDARTMADVFYPDFSSEDLINLPIGNCYVNLKTGRSNPVSFSMQTIYSNEPGNLRKAEDLKEMSLARYTIKRDIACQNLLEHEEMIKNLI